MSNIKVSVIMPCRNEEKYIARSLGSLLLSDYPKENMEIIVIDGQSQDKTLEILKEIASMNPIVKILNNPKKITPTALNIAIKESKGEIIIRADAHAEYPPDYVNQCVKYLQKSDAWCVGGPVWCIGGPFQTEAVRGTFFGKIISLVLSSPFGVGGAKFRTKKEKMYVDTVPFGAFYKKVFDKVGLYDERLVRNEDNELADRIAKSGGKIYMTPEIKNIYYCEENLIKFLKKTIFGAMWNPYTQKLYPYTFKWRHFIPMVFFLGVSICLIFTGISLLNGDVYFSLLSFLPLSLYFILAIFSAFLIYKKNKIPFLYIPAIAIVFFLYHFSYGYGIFKGWLLVIFGLWEKKVPIG